MRLEQTHEPEFSQPIRQIALMLFVLLMAGVGSFVAYPSVSPIFLASPYLNGIILVVFAFGVGACFRQVFTLISSVSWIEGFALDRPGHEFIRSPRLLASLAALLRETRARRALTSTSSRSILDSVATRLDEARDITRYIVNLLIFLGLLGTFYGLATTVPAVVDTIRSLEPKEGQTAIESFENLMTGLERQLGGMGTAFSSSLLGLAGSLVVGLLELFAGHGQNRFYRELEEWLSSITQIGLASRDGEEGASSTSGLSELMEQSTVRLETLSDLFARSEEDRLKNDHRLEALSESVNSLVGQLAAQLQTEPAAADQEILQRIVDAQEQIAAGNRQLVEAQGRVVAEQERGLNAQAQNAAAQERLIEVQERMAQLLQENLEEGGGLDSEARMRLRNIDVQLLRILEEMAAGRQDTMAELRQDLAALVQSIRDVAMRQGR
ncbi:MAG: biopolymer transporter ExbB [Paracoccaceae bacterium]